ncbi:hypothetical protein [Pseudomonas sp.]|uniref:hypothetical protein n=1 Tax=Pseudomonas sp. TaxID=306 RepID=UPI003C738350
MGYVSKSLGIGQQIVVMLDSTANREEVAARLTLDGIRLRVIEVKARSVKVGVRGPSGLTPARGPDVEATEGGLSLTRTIEQEIVITLREGGSAGAALDWLASEGVSFRLLVIEGRKSVFRVKACDDLLILRDELVSPV